MISTTLLIVSLFVLSARADDCYEDDFGNVNCDNTFGTAPKIGTGVGIFAFLFVLMVIGLIRRRRIQQRNVSLIVTQQQQTTTVYPQQYNSGALQYPPQTYPSGYNNTPPTKHDSLYATPPGYPNYSPSEGTTPIQGELYIYKSWNHPSV